MQVSGRHMKFLLGYSGGKGTNTLDKRKSGVWQGLEVARRTAQHLMVVAYEGANLKGPSLVETKWYLRDYIRELTEK